LQFVQWQQHARCRCSQGDDADDGTVVEEDAVMDDTQLAPDAMATAEALVAQRKAKLDAACAEARASRSREDCLTDRQDLLRLEQLIRDHPHRQSHLAKARDAYQEAYEQRLAEKQRECPFQTPTELAGRLERPRWLAHALEGATDAHLESLLTDARLDDADRATITARIKANCARLVPVHTLWKPSKRPAGLGGGTDAEWAQYVKSVNEGLRSLERELDEQRRAHENTLRCDVERELHSLKEEVEVAQAALLEAEMALGRQREIDDYVACRMEAFVDTHTREEQTAYNAAVGKREEAQRRLEAQQREWWAAVAMHPIASLVEQLASAPAEHVTAVLDRLLALPTTDPHVHQEGVHQFLLAHREFAHGLYASAPVIVASVGRLVATGDDETARALLDLCPAAEHSPLAGVVAYLRYVLREEPDLSGVTAYRSLTPDDLLLGAYYYEGGAAPTLQRRSHWEYLSLERSLRGAAKDGNAKYLNDFKVRGLQPRIAELAFREVVCRLRGEDAARALCDLNAERVASIAPPRTLASLPPLPSADWADEDGRRYDVKCNLFYPSKEAKVGLLGFLIELKQPSDRHCSYPAFVFTNKTNDSCRWVYVGEYRPGAATKDHAKDRILPFYCRLPDEVRFVLPNTKNDLDAGMRLLRDRFLRLGWQLAVGLRAVPPQEATITAESFLDDVVERCVRWGGGTCLEHAIWRALTETTLDACSRYDRAAVCASLKFAEELIGSRALPVRLPRIEGKPILSRWIDDVLKPLVEHWSLIRCPACGISPTRPGTIRLGVTGMTSEGTIYGGMTCEQCGHVADGVTLLTHCYECNHYPLIIGKNRLCEGCKGLVCKWRQQDTGPACECCKIGCRRRQARTEEGIQSDIW
jgi:hypothetical protein